MSEPCPDHNVLRDSAGACPFCIEAANPRKCCAAKEAENVALASNLLNARQTIGAIYGALRLVPPPEEDDYTGADAVQRIADLEEALAPFAKVARILDNGPTHPRLDADRVWIDPSGGTRGNGILTVLDFRRAGRVLKETP